MLQIRHVCKQYQTGKLIQKALDDVSLSFRDSEFVAVLCPSGSGKTTLLNVIGGLDRYDGGNLIINGISTEEYRDRDWDSYRNHTIGFVFQSYNLIPHQTILSNVELALTISGVAGHGGSSGRWMLWRRWGWQIRPRSGRRSFPAVRCSGWRSPSWFLPS